MGSVRGDEGGGFGFLRGRGRTHIALGVVTSLVGNERLSIIVGTEQKVLRLKKTVSKGLGQDLRAVHSDVPHSPSQWETRRCPCRWNASMVQERRCPEMVSALPGTVRIKGRRGAGFRDVELTTENLEAQDTASWIEKNISVII